jgi:hypothetical protein
MRFTLTYRGKLKANGGPQEKQRLRRHFHRQLRELWAQPPLVELEGVLDLNPFEGHLTLIKAVGQLNFASIVSSELHMYADLRVEFLRPGPPGSLVTSGGDIDNRLKTLLDSLKIPEADALPPSDHPNADETPFHCLLEDDALIGALNVRTDRLLDAGSDTSEVSLLIEVQTHTVSPTHGILGL